MSDYSTTASVELTVNGAKAKQELERQKKLVDDLTAAYARAAAAGDKPTMKQLHKDLTQARKGLRTMQSDIKNVEDVLRRLDKATPNELRSTLKQLNKDLGNMERGSSVWNAQIEKIKQVKAELEGIKNEFKEIKPVTGGFIQTIQQWQVSLFKLFDQIKIAFSAAKEYVNTFAAMEQEMANVSKYSGLTAEQVASLNEEFKKMDTRTPREELNKLAQEAGRLGKTSQEDILGFVNAADKINVALDDLGEGATLTLSKLTDIFGDEDRLGTEQALLSVGSVINELSQNCSASAPYLAEFASRLGGVGSQAGMTIQQVMGFAAVLDSNNQNVEASATALSQLITRLYQTPEKYAKAAGLEVTSFTKLLKEDANAALITLFESLNKMGNMDVLSPIFKDMGETGARAVAALSTLSGNIDDVKRQQENANIAFEEAVSIDKEYNVQNNTKAAGLDKTKNKIHELEVELGEKLYPIVVAANNAAASGLKIISAIVGFVIKYKSELIGLTAAVAAYTIAVNLATIKTKIMAAVTVAVNAAQKLWLATSALLQSALLLLTGRVTAATQSFKVFAATLKLSPLGLLVSAITAAVAALVIFIAKTKEATIAEKSLANIREGATTKLEEEKQALETLLQVARNEKESLDNRHKAIDKLNKIIPNYNGQLDDTTGKYRENKVALDEYLKSLKAKYELEGAKEEMKSLGQRKAKAIVERAAAQKELAKEVQIAKKNIGETLRIGGEDVPSTPYMSGDEARPQIRTQLSVAALSDKVRGFTDTIEEVERAEKTILRSYKEALLDDTEETKTGPDYTPLDPEKDPDTTAVEDNRFKKEKDMRDTREAQTRVAYAKGEIDYDNYRKRLIQIDIDYYEALMASAEANADEQRQFEMQYYDSKNKLAKTEQDITLEQENETYDEILRMEKQRYLDGKISKEVYQRAIELAELEHKRKLVDLYKDGTAEKLRAEKDYQDALIKEKETAQQRIVEKEKRLSDMQSRFFGLTEEERTKKLAENIALLDQIYAKEIEAAGDNAEEKERIDKKYIEAKKVLAQEAGVEISENERRTFKSGIQNSAEWLQSDGGKALTGGISVLTSGMGAIFSELTNQIQAELEIQTAAIEKRYSKEVSFAEGNTFKVKKLEKQKEEDIANEKNKANKKMFKMQVIQAVAQMAQNALSAYGSAAAIPVVGFILAPIAAAMAVAAGMLQIASIKKQQQASESQGYASGGFTGEGGKYEPAGIVHKGEWVASQELLASPVARPMINALDYAQRTNTIGSIRSTDVSRGMGYAQPQVVTVQVPAPQSQISGDLSGAIKQLNSRLNEPFVTVNTVTGDTGIKKAQDDYDRLIKNKSPKYSR